MFKLNSQIRKISPSYSLLILNFCFVASYALLGPHALFLHTLDESGKQWIVLGMSLFATTQVGGVWLLSLIKKGLENSEILMFSLRLISICIMVWAKSPISTMLSLAFFGFSQAIFYKTSRMKLSLLISRNLVPIDTGYLWMAISTNLTFMLITPLGSFFIGSKFSQVLLFLIGCGFLLFSFGLNFLLNNSFHSIIEEFNNSKSIKIGNETKLFSEKTIGLDEEGSKKKDIFLDLIRFLIFLLPYSIIQSLIPIIISKHSLESMYNSVLLGLNALVVMSFYLISTKIRSISKFSLVRYDIISFFAFLFMILSFFSSVYSLFIIVFLWSFCEAYQLPNIEYLLFTKRKYPDTWINNFLALDAIACFIGPIIALEVTRLPTLISFFDNEIAYFLKNYILWWLQI